MSRSGLLFRGVFFVAVALYPFLVYFGLKYLPPGLLGLILAILLAFRFGILTTEEKPVLFPMMVVIPTRKIMIGVAHEVALICAMPILGMNEASVDYRNDCHH